jgi:phosphoserine aminotransferase
MPLPVLEQIQNDLLDYNGQGLSVLEMSHRSDAFADIAQRAEAQLRSLLAIPENYSVLFMQGGATAQFSHVVQNLDSERQALYLNSGHWAQRAIDAASLLGDASGATVTEVAVANKKPHRFVPGVMDWELDTTASYLHITDNETVDGLALRGLDWQNLSAVRGAALPVVCDMSSSILSEEVNVSDYALIYAGAQKNIGPAGLTIVIARDDMIERAKSVKGLAKVFNYSAVATSESMLITPPTFAWYCAGLVFDWLLSRGGLREMQSRNKQRAAKLYALIDKAPIYQNRVLPTQRSVMNVTFELTQPDLQTEFLKDAEKAGIVGLKGHKAVGGLRASLYNAVPESSIDALSDYLQHFAQRYS